MKTNTKKWLASGAALSLAVLSLAGCGSSTKTASSPSPSASSSTKPADSAKPSDNGGAKKISGDFEIQYFVGGYGDKWWKQMIGEFQKKYPDLKIKETAGSQINEQTKPRWVQGNPPDFVYIDGAGANPRTMFLDDQLMDLTDYLKDAKNAEGNKILDGLIAKPEEYTKGKYYTLRLLGHVLRQGTVQKERLGRSDRLAELPRGRRQNQSRRRHGRLHPHRRLPVLHQRRAARLHDRGDEQL